MLKNHLTYLRKEANEKMGLDKMGHDFIFKWVKKSIIGALLGPDYAGFSKKEVLSNLIYR